MNSTEIVLAENIRIAFAHWVGLVRFVNDGNLEIDTKPVENQIRSLVLTRKNALFAWTAICAKTWALLASIVATYTLSGKSFVYYLADILSAILERHPDPRSRTSCLGGTHNSAQAHGLAIFLGIVTGSVPNRMWKPPSSA